jgi:hypothetical protein
VLRGGRLLQRYLVDMWASEDQNRLQFLRMNQANLRASLYSGLEDALHAGDDNIDLNELGQRTVLPSSYIGGPRHMGYCTLLSQGRHLPDLHHQSKVARDHTRVASGPGCA